MNPLMLAGAGALLLLFARKGQSLPASPSAMLLPSGSSGRTPVAAARALAAYFAKGGSRGSKGKPDPVVKQAQADMGTLTADGIYGAKTRARAHALGVELPAIASKPKAAASLVLAPVDKAGRASVDAAKDLAAHIASGGSKGTKGKPNATVRAAQADMGGLTADGIYGAKTRARAAALGVTIVEPPTKPGTPPAPSAAPMAAPAPPPKPRVTSAAPPPAPTPASSRGYTPEQAARSLGEYLAQGGSRKSAYVKDRQADMGGLKPDGVYGPSTRARAAALGVVLPRTPKEAASELGTYLRGGGSKGSKGAPSAAVKQAQTDMGGLAADGLYGPATRARGKALGVTLP
jgi:hypothetical protein